MYYMLKEILEQPDVCRRLVKNMGEFKDASDLLSRSSHINIVGSGSSHHAAVAGCCFFRDLVQKPSESYASSEFRAPKKKEKSSLILVSQSGETSDTLSCLKKSLGTATVAVVNDTGSPLASSADYVCDIKAGREYSVTATKTYTAEVAALNILATGTESLIKKTPSLIEDVLSKKNEIRELVDSISHEKPVFVLGSGYHTATALEGALKITEAAHTFSEALIPGEFLHGPKTLARESTIIVVAPPDGFRKKNIAVVKAIRGLCDNVICLCERGDDELISLDSRAVELPPAPAELTPVYYPVVLQLIAYFLAVGKGLNPDEPESLSKVVSGE